MFMKRWKNTFRHKQFFFFNWVFIIEISSAVINVIICIKLTIHFRYFNFKCNFNLQQQLYWIRFHLILEFFSKKFLYKEKNHKYSMFTDGMWNMCWNEPTKDPLLLVFMCKNFLFLFFLWSHDTLWLIIVSISDDSAT